MRKPMSLNAKILMIEAFKNNLQIYLDSRKETEQTELSKLDGSTFFSEAKSTLNREDDEVLIEGILSKQRRKIELDQ